ncbi:hypothetical protein GEMRC1_002017 [Eukaryota sp. GEM-RC1]
MAQNNPAPSQPAPVPTQPAPVQQQAQVIHMPAQYTIPQMGYHPGLAAPPKKGAVKQIVVVVAVILVLAVVIGINAFDLGLDIQYPYTVSVSGGAASFGIKGGTYGVDKANHKFYGELDVPFISLSGELFCLNDKIRAKILGQCTPQFLSVSYECDKLIDFVVPEIPSSAKRLVKRRK